MAAILDAAGVDRAVLGGMSLGGYLSLAFNLVCPQRVAALVLVDTGPGYRNDAARDKWNLWVERRAQELERGRTQADSSAELAQAVHEHPEGLPRAARGVMAQKDARVISSLDGITVPTLVIVGAQDTEFLAGADYMHRHIPSSRSVVIDDAGACGEYGPARVVQYRRARFSGTAITAPDVTVECAGSGWTHRRIRPNRRRCRFRIVSP